MGTAGNAALRSGTEPGMSFSAANAMTAIMARLWFWGGDRIGRLVGLGRFGWDGVVGVGVVGLEACKQGNNRQHRQQ